LKQENNKTKKTQKVQYDDDDNHHVQPNAIGNGGVVLLSQDGSFYTFIKQA